MEEIYVSTDVESDGPIPGPYSMLSFGSAAFKADGRMLGTYEVNLELLEGATQHPETMRFWEKNKEAYEYTREGTVDPKIAMNDYVKWLKKLDGKTIFIGYPAGYDFTFIYWYLHKFTHGSPFGFSALDIKTFGMFMLGGDYRKSAKRNYPKSWFGKTRHNHRGLDDAIGQGELFCNMLKEYREKFEK